MIYLTSSNSAVRVSAILFTTLVLGCVSPLRAEPPLTTQPASEASVEPRDESSITRVYDVRDLIQVVKPTPVSGGFAPTFPVGPDVSGSVPTPESLSNLIKANVDAQSWQDNGGLMGKLTFFSGSLIVSQTEQNHALIADLLQQLRTIKPEVLMTVLWVDLPASRLNELTKVVGSTRVFVNPVPQEFVVGQFETTVALGDAVEAKSTAFTNYVAKIQPVVSANTVGLSPTINNFDYGVKISGRIKPIDAKTVGLDLRIEQTELARMDSATISGGTIQLPVLLNRSADAKMRVPLNQPVVVNLMRDPAAARVAPDETLLRLVVVSVADVE